MNQIRYIVRNKSGQRLAMNIGYDQVPDFDFTSHPINVVVPVLFQTYDQAWDYIRMNLNIGDYDVTEAVVQIVEI